MFTVAMLFKENVRITLVHMIVNRLEVNIQKHQYKNYVQSQILETKDIIERTFDTIYKFKS